MSSARRSTHLLRATLVALPLAIVLAGCETMENLNPFAEKQTPLPGERKALFPDGVPGVDFSSPPPQPMNSNIPIPSSISADDDNPDQHGQQTEMRAGQGPAGGPGSDDAWSGTR